MLTVRSPDNLTHPTDVAELIGVHTFDADPNLIRALDGLAGVVNSLVLRLAHKDQAAVLAALLGPQNLALVEPAK